MEKRREGDGFAIGSDAKDRSPARYLADLFCVQTTNYFKSRIDS